MFCHTCQPQRSDDAPKLGKIRPASHSYLAQCEPLVAATIASLSGFLILVGVWLVRLLG